MRTIKFVSLFLVIAANQAHATTLPVNNGTISPSEKPLIERFLGSFSASDNSLFSTKAGVVKVSLDASNHLRLTSTMDITGMDCGSSVGALVGLEAFGQNDPVEAYFRLNKARCPDISGDTVTLHYNQALTGQDIFEVEVEIEAGTGGPEGGGVHQNVKTWILERL